MMFWALFLQCCVYVESIDGGLALIILSVAFMTLLRAFYAWVVFFITYNGASSDNALHQSSVGFSDEAAGSFLNTLMK